MVTNNAYSRLQITLHWSIAILIAIAWFLGDGMGKIWRDRMQAGTTGIEGNTWHVWVGGAVFLLVLIRIVVRLTSAVPAPEPAQYGWQEKAALWGHRALYLMMVVVPALGASAWYLHIKAAGEAHEIAVSVLLVLIAGHTILALYHHYIAKDGTLRRMVPSLK